MPSTAAHTAPAPAPEAHLDADDLTLRLRRMLTAPGYRPPLLPGVALEIMQIAQRPKVQFAEVVALLEKDALLAAKVLALASSAAYATRTPVSSLYQATIRLGLNTLRNLVLEAALHLRVFRVPGYEEPMQRLARHSAAVAHITRATCARTNVDAGFAFACGLLHDVGFAGALLALAEDRQFRYQPFDTFAPALDELHEEAGGLMTRVWKLPAEIAAAVGAHHQVEGEHRTPLHAALVVAEQLAWEAGVGLAAPPAGSSARALATPEAPIGTLDVETGVTLQAARAVLGLDDLALGALRAEAFEIADRLG
jgi:HD-like signal output (HDOD) protein